MVDEYRFEDSENQYEVFNRDSLLIADDESEEDSQSQLLENRKWSWRYMKTQLQSRNLEALYLRYSQILHKGYFSVFLLLQVIVTAIHVGFLISGEVEDPQHTALPDIILYISFTLILWPLVAVVFNQGLVTKFPSLPHVVSCLAIAIGVVVDIALPIYHTVLFHSRATLRPAYAIHALLACYIFLPLRNSLVPLILGLGITSCHLLALITVTYRNSEIAHRQVFAEVIFFLCVNGLGLYYRFVNEIVIRRTFLDRRACVEFTVKLNYEKEQEEQLLLSILPRHIAARVKEDIRKKSLRLNSSAEPLTRKPFKDLYIEKHDNVSILYADVVNYTKMTSSLPVNKLVETLNELFGRFDEASEEHRVLRIKFLGDCYYCASGIPQPNPNHAKSCVDLALKMIAIIKVVRQERRLDIDMRIGVHSGSILSGLIGKSKWQYDIWSRDVIIANRMEQSGKPGMVHITKQTFDLLGDKYVVEPGNGHLRDELLDRYNIRTYLLGPQEERRGVISGDANLAISRRRTAFMNNNLIMYQQMLKMADVYMERAIDSLPIGGYSQWFHNTQIRPLCLTFREDGSWELPFTKRPDPLFKFYVLSALFVSCCMTAMKLLGLPSLHWISWSVFAVSTAGLILLVPLTWSHYVWNAFKDPKCQMEHIPEPRNKVLRLLCKCSVKIIWNCYLRTFVYFVVCFLLTVCSLADVINHFNEVVDCRKDVPALEPVMRCESPWHITESCSLAILMNFLFIRVHFQLKLLVGICILSVYSWCIVSLNLDCVSEETWNPGLEPRVAHILSLVFVVIGLHLMDRQSEFMNRLDYSWKRQLGKEKDEAEKTRSINLMLLHNILPIHVAKVYLNINRTTNDLYHENYDCVAVMFASLTNYCLYDDKDVYHSEIRSLEILNQIICEFDDALFETKFKTIEKIKVTGSTYMAACGLHPGLKASNQLNCSSAAKMVVNLVEFATTVMRRLQKINKSFNTDFKLRIGISHGPVTAGVVGSQKPLYDIWGNAVNVASRMDSTGEPDAIQVTASTADILQQEGVKCVFRGPTFVKGKGIMETYFVKLTSDFHLHRRTRM